MGYDYSINGKIYFTGKINQLKKQFEKIFEVNDVDIDVTYDKDIKITTINFNMSWHNGGGFFESCSENIVKFLKKNNILDANGIITEHGEASEFTSVNAIKKSEIVDTCGIDDLEKLLKEKHDI
jgi:hypothetical protein